MRITKQKSKTAEIIQNYPEKRKTTVRQIDEGTMITTTIINKVKKIRLNTELITS